MSRACGWCEPAFDKSGAGVHCRRCHRRCEFDIHVNQWVHAGARRRGGAA